LADLSGFIAGLPKAELHVHQVGSASARIVAELAQRHPGTVPADPAELAAFFEFRDFAHFIEVWVWKNRFLREREDFTIIAEETARNLAAQRVLYAELFYSPGDHLHPGLDAAGITEAIRKGFDRVPEIELALVADLIRDHGPERAGRMLEVVGELKDEFGVLGIGIGGSEQRFPPEPFASVYERARELGFRTSAHAGEAAGAESVWGALRALRPDRIGHGTRAVEDPALLVHLAERRIPLELCVLSNLRTGVVASVAAHPARIYFERGIPISINTDDPTLFNNSLAEEYLALHEELGFSLEDIHRVIEQAVGSCWLHEERKIELLEKLRAGEP